jgi:hypothetical protein
MNRRVIFAAALMSAFLAASLTSSATQLQDSAQSQSQASSQKAQGSLPAVPSPEEHKKTKKVWTNDNLGDVSGSATSQVGERKSGSSTKGAPARPASSQEIASYRKQLATLQGRLTGVDKQIADLKSFSKGEVSGANGMQLHKSYSTEPVEDQVRKLEEKRKSLAAKMDAVFDAARKQGIEPGQLR